jgi:hypothetical protein
MMDDPQLLLELLEYKAADLVAGRDPRGGRESFSRLLARIRTLDSLEKLSAVDRDRLRMVERTLQAGTSGEWNLEGPAPVTARPEKGAIDVDALAELQEDPIFDSPDDPPEAPALSLAGAPIAEPPASNAAPAESPVLAMGPEAATPGGQIELDPEDQDSASRAEREALARLSELADSAAFRDALTERARDYLRDKYRYALRLLHAVPQNLDAYRRSPDFAGDTQLARFRVQIPVVGLGDPLLTFRGEDVALAVLEDLINLVASLKRPGSPYNALQISPDRALDYLRSLALKVAEDHTARTVDPHRPRPGGTISVRELQTALEVLAREPLGYAEKAAQRARLQKQLEEARAVEKREETVVAQDRDTFLRHADDFFAFLRIWLPREYGGTHSIPAPENRVLFAAHPARRLESVPPNARRLVIRVRHPFHLTFAGTEVAISPMGADLSVVAADREHTLGDEAVFEADGGGSIRVLRWDRWLQIEHFPQRVIPAAPIDLGRLLRIGRVVAILVDFESDPAFESLRLLRLTAARARRPDAVDAREFGPATSDQYRQMGMEALERFSRNGVETVLDLFSRLSVAADNEIGEALSAAADALKRADGRGRYHDRLPQLTKALRNASREAGSTLPEIAAIDDSNRAGVFRYPPEGGVVSILGQPLGLQVQRGGQPGELLTVSFQGGPAREVHDLAVMRVPGGPPLVIARAPGRLALYLVRSE